MDADEAQLGGLLPDFFGALVAGFHLGDQRLVELTLDKVFHRLLDLFLLGGQCKFHLVSFMPTISMVAAIPDRVIM